MAFGLSKLRDQLQGVHPWFRWSSAHADHDHRTSGSRPACAPVSGIADPFNGHIDECRIPHVQRSDSGIETTWNNMSDPDAFAVARAEEQSRLGHGRTG